MFFHRFGVVGFLYLFGRTKISAGAELNLGWSGRRHQARNSLVAVEPSPAVHAVLVRSVEGCAPIKPEHLLEPYLPGRAVNESHIDRPFAGMAHDKKIRHSPRGIIYRLCGFDAGSRRQGIPFAHGCSIPEAIRKYRDYPCSTSRGQFPPGAGNRGQAECQSSRTARCCEPVPAPAGARQAA